MYKISSINPHWNNSFKFPNLFSQLKMQIAFQIFLRFFSFFIIVSHSPTWSAPLYYLSQAVEFNNVRVVCFHYRTWKRKIESQPHVSCGIMEWKFLFELVASSELKFMDSVSLFFFASIFSRLRPSLWHLFDVILIMSRVLCVGSRIFLKKLCSVLLSTCDEVEKPQRCSNCFSWNWKLLFLKYEHVFSDLIGATGTVWNTITRTWAHRYGS